MQKANPHSPDPTFQWQLTPTIHEGESVDAPALILDEVDPEMLGWGFADWGVYSLLRWHKAGDADDDKTAASPVKAFRHRTSLQS